MSFPTSEKPGDYSRVAMEWTLIRTERPWRGREEVEIGVCPHASESSMASFRPSSTLGDGCPALNAGDGGYRTLSQGDCCQAVWTGDI